MYIKKHWPVFTLYFLLNEPEGSRVSQRDRTRPVPGTLFSTAGAEGCLPWLHKRQWKACVFICNYLSHPQNYSNTGHISMFICSYCLLWEQIMLRCKTRVKNVSSFFAWPLNLSVTTIEVGPGLQCLRFTSPYLPLQLLSQLCIPVGCPGRNPLHPVPAQSTTGIHSSRKSLLRCQSGQPVLQLYHHRTSHLTSWF